MNGNATTVLWKVGRRTGRMGVAAVTHWIGLFSASALLVLTGWLLVGAHAVFAGREARIVGREPVYITADDERAVAYWVDHGDIFHDRQFITVHISPLRPDSAPPPGLGRWPQPGEAYLSPALLAADRSGALRERYGHFGGTVGLDGLAEPSEWFAYIRPSSDQAFARYGDEAKISGFGSPSHQGGEHFTAGLSRRRYDEMYLLLLFAVALPVAALVGVAVRSGATQRDRRLALLGAIGASRMANAWLLAGEASIPTALGALTGGALAGLTTLTDVRLPVVDYTIMATDLAAYWNAIVALSISVVAAVLAAVIGTQLRRREWTTPSRHRPTRARRWPPALFLVAFAAMIWSAQQGRYSGSIGRKDELSAVFTLALFVAFATFPSLLASGVAAVGVAVGRLGRRTGWISALVGGKWLARQPTGVVRVAAAGVIGMGILALVQVWVSQHAMAGNWSVVRDRVHQELITVRTTAPDEAAQRFTDKVGPQFVLWVGENDDGVPLLAGDCAAIGQLGILTRCPSSPMPATEAYSWLNERGRAVRDLNASILVGREPLISTHRQTEFRHIGFIVANLNGTAGTDNITRTAFALLPIPEITVAGQLAVAGVVTQTDTYRWIWLLGIAGALVLMLATSLGAVDVFLSQARSLGPIGLFHNRRPLFAAIAAWNIALPFAIVSIVGAFTAAVVAQLYIELAGTGLLSWTGLGIAMLVVCIIGTTLAAFCSEVALRSTRRWRPMAD